MRWLLAWSLYLYGRAIMASSRWFQGDGPGPWLPPAPDWRKQLVEKREAFNDD